MYDTDRSEWIIWSATAQLGVQKPLWSTDKACGEYIAVHRVHGVLLLEGDGSSDSQKKDQ